MRGPDLLHRPLDYAERTAVIDDGGEWTYGDLLDRSHAVAAALLDGRHDLHGARVLLLAEPGLAFTAALFAIWRAGGIAVPLSAAMPAAEWVAAAADSRASFAVASASHVPALEPVAAGAHVRIVRTDVRPRSGQLPVIDPARSALMLYTSGTTSRPKGVVLSHAAIQAQVESLVEAWEWRDTDRILHVLPLHHTHGIVNALLCPLWVGAVCEMLPAFDATRVWGRLASGHVSVFMAVPTVYRRLLAAWEGADAAERRAWADGARQLRVAISGSAALPVPVFEQWRRVTGQSLLERYGMTETGMVLSNPLHGDRLPGVVGRPLPGVEVRLVDASGADVEDGVSGELLVRGAGIFTEYWDRPEATAQAFLPGGWFRTGDAAIVANGQFRILGRLSVDIIKTGGEKVSALEIEDVLRTHPAIDDCAVVGVPDPEWGEAVAVAVVPAPGASLTIEALRVWARARLSPWKIPKRLQLVPSLPRTALGKVAKARLPALFAGDAPPPA